MKKIKYFVLSLIICIPFSVCTAASQGSDINGHNTATASKTFKDSNVTNVPPFISVLCYTDHYAGESTSTPTLITEIPNINIINNTPWDISIGAVEDAASNLPPVAGAVVSAPYNITLLGYANPKCESHGIKVPLYPPDSWGTWKQGNSNAKSNDGSDVAWTFTVNASGASANNKTLIFNAGGDYGYFNQDGSIARANPLPLAWSSPIYGVETENGIGFKSYAWVGSWIPSEGESGGKYAECSNMAAISLTANYPSSWIVSATQQPFIIQPCDNGGSVMMPHALNMNVMVCPSFETVNGVAMDLIAYLFAPDGGEVSLMFFAIPNKYDQLAQPYTSGKANDPRGN